MSDFGQTLRGLSRGEIHALAPALLERLSPGSVGTRRKNSGDYSEELQAREDRRSTLPAFPENDMSESRQPQPADRPGRENRSETQEPMRQSRRQWAGNDGADDSVILKTQTEPEKAGADLRFAPYGGRAGAAAVLRPGQDDALPGGVSQEMERISEYFRRDAMRYDGGFKRY